MAEKKANKGAKKAEKRGGKRPGAGRKPGGALLVPCPWNCGKYLKRRELLQHVKTCELRRVIQDSAGAPGASEPEAK